MSNNWHHHFLETWMLNDTYQIRSNNVYRYPTYVVGSNMLESMKHWVAMGGAMIGVAGAGTPPGGALGILSALAATGGIWKPVPVTHKKYSTLATHLQHYMSVGL